MSETAVWTSEDGSIKITYPLPLFHEIDFDVNEGYRRIPRGGIEIGGIFFGRATAETVEVVLRRAIDCEHLFGPSFKLSDKDIAGARTRIQAARTDVELAGLEPLGWYIAHTRSDLVLTDAEVQQFNDLFPGPRRFTLLVKPEKFKPTRFAFLVRNEHGEVPLDGRERSFLLPLPGRAAPTPAHSEPPPPPTIQPLPEAAPALAPAAEEATPEPHIEELSQGASNLEAELPSPLSDFPKGTPEPNKVEPEPRLPERSLSPEPGDVETLPLPPWSDSWKRPPEAVVPERPLGAQAGPPVPQETPSLPQEPPPATRPLERAQPTTPLHSERARARLEERDENLRPVLREAKTPRRRWLVLLISALLGCLAGYALYREMPAPIMDVKIEPRETGYVVSWPADQTRSADVVLIRVNDGEPETVSPADRLVGHTSIPGSNAPLLKVEIIAHYPLGDSRGIVELVK